MQTSQQSRHHYQWTGGSEKFKWQLPWKLPKKASSSFISGLSRNSRKYLRYSVYHGSNRLSTSTAFGTQTDIETVGCSPDWTGGYSSKSTSSAPVVYLFNGAGRSRMTFAFSDTLNPVVCKAGVNEETAVFHCSVILFEEPTSPLDNYEATLRVDLRDLAYYDCLNDVQKWWSGLPGLTPSPVPVSAREPMYSTWYSFHQNVKPEAIEEQCRLAKALGCETVIVDDGWQTSDNTRGYAYCGDWEVCADKIPDMKAHVERVHNLGLKYMLWYSVPFVGEHSKAWDRFCDRMLYKIESRGYGIVDPRYPEVREYLI